MTKNKKKLNVNDSILESSGTYMDIRFHCAEGTVRQLKVPTIWDPVNERWLATIVLPNCKCIIKAICEKSFDLQNEFLKEINKLNEIEKEELFDMFVLIN